MLPPRCTFAVLHDHPGGPDAGVMLYVVCPEMGTVGAAATFADVPSAAMHAACEAWKTHRAPSRSPLALEIAQAIEACSGIGEWSPVAVKDAGVTLATCRAAKAVVTTLPTAERYDRELASFGKDARAWYGFAALRVVVAFFRPVTRWEAAAVRAAVEAFAA